MDSAKELTDRDSSAFVGVPIRTVYISGVMNMLQSHVPGILFMAVCTGMKKVVDMLVPSMEHANTRSPLYRNLMGYSPFYTP